MHPHYMVKFQMRTEKLSKMVANNSKSHAASKTEDAGSQDNSCHLGDDTRCVEVNLLESLGLITKLYVLF